MPRLKNIQNGAIVNVDDATAARLGSGWRPAGETALGEAPDKSWKVADLKSFAETNGIDLGDATKKDDILAVIANPAPVGAADDDEDESDDSE
ncbi:MAG: hypothetical protein ABWX92_15800 [Mycetocola sp.]